MKTFVQTVNQPTDTFAVRELTTDELESVAGALINSNSYSTTYQGGADGYGGSRRNP